METPNILFFDKCRLCLLHMGSSHIFDGSDLPHAIYNCTGVKVKKSDNLPQKICSKCLEIVEQARDLRKLAMKNDSHLKSLFGEKEEKFDESLEDIDGTDTETLTNDKSPEKEEKSNSSSDKHHKSKERSTEKLRHSDRPKKKKDKLSMSIKSESSSVVTSSTKGKDEKPRHKVIKKDGCEEYVCGVCDKHFKTWKKLYLHNRSHNKKIECPLDVCGKKFTTKGDLNKHMRTHTGVKPYTCDICDKKFAQQVTLKGHKENIHYIFTCT